MLLRLSQTSNNNDGESVYYVFASTSVYLRVAVCALVRDPHNMLFPRQPSTLNTLCSLCFSLMSPITNSYGTRNALAEGADNEPGTLASSVIDQRETRRDIFLPSLEGRSERGGTAHASLRDCRVQVGIFGFICREHRTQRFTCTYVCVPNVLIVGLQAVRRNLPHSVALSPGVLYCTACNLFER